MLSIRQSDYPMTGLLSNLEADVTVLSYRISGEEHQLKQHTSTGARKGHIKARMNKLCKICTFCF